jgi:hypothetical protein
MQGNADATTDETSGKEATDGDTYRGFSLRCGACEALAFDWIRTASGEIVLRCSSCGEPALEAGDAELGDRQRDRLDRLEERRVRV